MITLLPGDGIGPEVTASGKAVLKAIELSFGHKFKFEEKYIGGAAIDQFNDPLPSDTKKSCLDSNAVILGAVGGPKWDDPNAKIRPEQGLLSLRKLLGVFANIRPIKVYPSLKKSSPLKEEKLDDVDLIVIRELTGGIYFGEKKRSEKKASDLCEYHEFEVTRIIRKAADIAMQRQRKLCSVDKANVLETSRFWRDITSKIVSREYQDIEIEHILVDAAAMYLINNPSDFDVVVTENMFGDILTDEASMLSGSLGMLPSASLGDGSIGLYEPIHGSAPDITGTKSANPCGMIGSIAMLLRHSLNLQEEAEIIEGAMFDVIESGARTKDIAEENDRIINTDEMTQLIIDKIL